MPIEREQEARAAKRDIIGGLVFCLLSVETTIFSSLSKEYGTAEFVGIPLLVVAIVELLRAWEHISRLDVIDNLPPEIRNEPEQLEEWMERNYNKWASQDHPHFPS